MNTVSGLTQNPLAIHWSCKHECILLIWRQMNRLEWIEVAQEKNPVACSCELGNEKSDFSKNNRIFWPAKRPLAFQERLCSMELVR